MTSNLQAIVQLLQTSLVSGPQRQQAETQLLQHERTPAFSLSLLQIAAGGPQTFAPQDRLAAALCFKNFIRRNWVDEDGNYQLPQNEVDTIKRELVGLMIAAPPSIQTQLGEAISIIADSDFWERWETLVDDLVSRLAPDDPVVNNGVLQVAHSIFKRWRPLFASDELFTEVNHVLTRFSTPFLDLLQNIDQKVQQHQDDKATLEKYFNTLNTAFKLLFDLSCQDLPPVFEENLAGISALLSKYLQYDNELLHTGDESEPGLPEYSKAAVLEVLTLYVTKFEEDFRPQIGGFVGTAWNLLTTLSLDAKNDVLASRALNFLTRVVAIRAHAEAFNNEQVLPQVIERAVVPNLMLRDADIETFEDEPLEYLRRDLEGTDSETRRRAATDFLRQLMQQFQPLVTSVVMRYVEHYLQEYAADRASKWKSKDTAVYLFTSIAAAGVVTATHGVRTTNPNVNVIEFFSNHIAEDLTSDASHVILQVDAIRYLYTFRSQISSQQWQEALPMLVKHLSSPNFVVYTYTAIALERILYLTNEKGEPVVARSMLSASAQGLLQRLFSITTKETAPEKIQENEFLMRCIMRVLIVIKEDVASYIDVVLTNFINIIRVIRHNPSNPRFYYYLFEGVGALIRYAAPVQPELLESRLYNPFSEILSDAVEEFMPYSFQLLAALLESRPTKGLPEYYLSLVSTVVNPGTWEARGNIPALTRFLCALIARGGEQLLPQLEQILGVFQSLVAKKSTESNGFDLLESVITHFPVANIMPYLQDVLSILLTRLSKSRTETLSLRFVRLYHLMSARLEQGLGADAVIDVLEKVQPGVFAQLYTGIILPDTQKLSRPLDRKIAVISLATTLTDSAAFATKYAKGWSHTTEALLKLMINPPVPPQADDAIPDQDVDDVGFGVGFTQLNTCRRPPADLFPDVTDPRAWIGGQLRAADARTGGRIAGFVQQRLSDDTRSALSDYMR